MITRPASCILQSGYVDRKALVSVIKEYGATVADMDKMRDYYDGEHDIVNRIRAQGKPNAKLVHAFPRYITTMASGYLIGNPVSYLAIEEAQEEPLENLLHAYDKMNADSIDAELAKHASVYGKGIELAYADENSNPRTATIDPRNAFVVYDDTVVHAPLFGIHHYKRRDASGEDIGYRLNVYTSTAILGYNVSDLGNIPSEVPNEETPHFFDGVPMIEYWNNDEEEGDFKPVISLIDAYDILQSDRINDKTQFVDAILVLYGATIGSADDYAGDGEGGAADRRPPGERLRDDGFIEVPQGGKLEYVAKQLNETNVEVLKDAIKTDIHKMSMIPDLTDEQFAGNSSGVAMRYKLLGLEQLTKIKERWFREGLQSRLRLFGNFLGTKGKALLDVDTVQITFKRSLPANENEIAQMVAHLHGIVPDAILLEQLSFVSDAQSALDMLKEQKQESLERQKTMYSPYNYEPNGDDPNKVSEGA